MQKQWLRKNIDLSLLSGRIEDFFKSKGLCVYKEESHGKCTIHGFLEHSGDTRDNVTANISGKPEDFVIELLATERSRSSTLIGLATGIFGGGNILLRALKSKERLEKLENEFWVFVEDQVGQLCGSAQRTDW